MRSLGSTVRRLATGRWRSRLTAIVTVVGVTGGVVACSAGQSPPAGRSSVTWGPVTVSVSADGRAFPRDAHIDITRAKGGVGSPAASLIGGVISVRERGGRQPSAPVQLTVRVAPSRLREAALPLVVHYDEAAEMWSAEPTSVDARSGTVSVSVSSFSLFDLVDAVTWAAGSVLGNRAGDGPTGCGTPPPWAEGIVAYNGRNDPLRTCLSTNAAGELEAHVVNNRGYPVTLPLTSGDPRVRHDPAVPGDAVSMLALALVQRDAAAVVLAPGAQATLVYPRPDGSVTEINVHVRARTDALSYWTATMGAALSGFVANGLNIADPRVHAWNRIRAQVASAQGSTDCLLTVATATAEPPRDASTAVGALRTCSDQFQAVMRAEGVDGKHIGAFARLIKAVAIDDVAFKVIDRAADPVNGSGFDVDLRGPARGPAATDSAQPSCPTRQQIESIIHAYPASPRIEQVTVEFAITCDAGWASATVTMQLAGIAPPNNIVGAAAVLRTRNGQWEVADIGQDLRGTVSCRKAPLRVRTTIACG